MPFVADLHLHSRFARATSRALNPSNLHRWSALKGIGVVGTGDYTHPEWYAELEEQLEPAEEGLYRLKEAWRQPVEAALPVSCRNEVRFLLTVEISSIYKKNGRTRKVHNIVMLPSLEDVARLNRRLDAIGNLKSDGRPILGLDSRDLLEICLETCRQVLFVPAHIWTPHFAALGAASGFDSLEECYEDLLPHIFAVETGLSSDPPMNWRLSMLERYAIISNSDAHSPQKLAREATCFDTEPSYGNIYEALKTRDQRFSGTLEFYPEEGKYHYDGHRKCGIRWKPAQTLKADGRCPVCGRALTVGVLHRVERLADRPEGVEPPQAKPFEYLVPLPEVIGAAIGVGPNSKKVQTLYHRLLERLGPELGILRHLDPVELERLGEGLVAEGIRRMRAGGIDIAAGYDGEYGVVRVFSDEERQRLSGQALLFGLAPTPRQVPPAPTEPAARPAEGAAPTAAAAQPDQGGDGLDEDQRRAVTAAGPLIVIAGPGAGKTRTLTHRIAELILRQGVEPGAIAAVTFTRRAAAEMRQRLQRLLPDGGLDGLKIGTFHRLALDLEALDQEALDQKNSPAPILLDPREARSLLEAGLEAAGLEVDPRAMQEAISLAKAAGQPLEQLPDPLAAAYRAYQEQLALVGARDFDDILLDFVHRLEDEPQRLAALRRARPHLLVDEFQDVNAVQYRLVQLWAGDGAGLFAIGDPDQAVYAFRGADPRYFSRLQDDFPQARVVRLGRNYRSAGGIVQAAAALIGHNPDRPPLKLLPVRPAGTAIRLLEASSPQAEGIAVARGIAERIGGTDMLQSDAHPKTAGAARSLADFAVLFRTGRQAEALEVCLQQAGLPYRVAGRDRFLEAPGVRAAVAFCRLVQQPDSPLRLLYVLEHPPWRPAPALLKKLRRHLPQGSGALLAALPPAQRRPAEALLANALELDGASPTACLAGFGAHQDGTPDAEWEHLVGMAASCDRLDEFLDLLLLGRDGDLVYPGTATPPNAETVTLMTLHAAKGLEFPVVFVCGVEDGLIPIGREDADIAEERRLFYVGLTRAVDELVLLRAKQRNHHGQPRQNPPSPFLAELPPELLSAAKEGPSRPLADRQLSLF